MFPVSQKQKPKPIDIQRFEQVQKTTLEMLTTMFGGLAEISKCNETEADATVMKNIAADTLIEIKRIAMNLEGQNNASQN